MQNLSAHPMLDGRQSDMAVTGAPRPLPSPARLQELLFDAARLGRTDVIPALLYAGADISGVDDKGYTPLILASYHGHEQATALLLEHGACVDQPDQRRGNSALMGVAFKGHEAVAERLLSAGANVNARNFAGQTALMMASLFGRATMVERLLAAGADPHLVDIAGDSAMSVAQMQGNTRLLGMLKSLPRA